MADTPPSKSEVCKSCKRKFCACAVPRLIAAKAQKKPLVRLLVLIFILFRGYGLVPKCSHELYRPIYQIVKK